jgi:hypothetical protein
LNKLVRFSQVPVEITKDFITDIHETGNNLKILRVMTTNTLLIIPSTHTHTHTHTKQRRKEQKICPASTLFG